MIKMSTQLSYRAVLLYVSKRLKEEEVKELRFLCSDSIPESVAEKIQHGYELFQELEKRARISSMHCEFLKWLLATIEREDLVKKLSEGLQQVCTISETSIAGEEMSQELLPVKKPRRHSLASCDGTEAESAIQMQKEASDSAALSEIDERCMREAIDASQNSDDNNTKVGAVLVHLHPSGYTVISCGCNSFPKGLKDRFPTSRDAADPADRKYPYIIFAIENALHPEGCAPPDVRGCVAYTTLMPAGESAKSVVISGITEVVYLEDKYPDSPATRASRRLLRECRIPVRQYTPKWLPAPLLAK